MILIEIKRDKKGNYTGLISQGHAIDLFQDWKDIENWKEETGNQDSPASFSDWMEIRNGNQTNSETRIGNNILCAAVSVLVQTLYKKLKIMSNVSRETIRKGFLEFEVLEINRDTNLIFDVIITGIHNLFKQYPEEIQLVESNI